MSKHLTIVDTQAEVKEATKNLEEPYVILVKDDDKLIYQDDSHCDAVLLIDDWNNYHTEIPVIQKDISWIKGRRCLVKKTTEGVAICYLDENNSELFHDGVTQAKLDGSMGQWMTDLPEFSYQCTEGESDWIKLHINKEPTLENKSRRVLVGVTKAVDRHYKLWSCKYALGSTNRISATTRLTPVANHNYANALGAGFDIVDYETYCKVAYMFMTKYKSKDPQGMKQFSHQKQASYDIYIGDTSALGNNDGNINNEQDTNTQVAIFGIEDWYGNIGEFMGGIHCNNTRGTGLVYYIYDGYEPDKIPTVPYRIIKKDFMSLSDNGYISRLEWGDHADLIPIEFSGASKYFYSDWGIIGNSGWRVVTRSGKGDLSSGLFSFQSDVASDIHNYSIGSRIQYRGNIEVIEDPQEFIALPTGFEDD